MLPIKVGSLETMVTSTYGERLAEAMRDAEVSPGSLAKHLGVSYQAVKKVLDGRTKSFTAANNFAAAAYLSVRPEWLATNVSPKRLVHDSHNSGQTAPLLWTGNVQHAEIRGRLPLISWVQAGAMNGVVDMFRAGDADTWISPNYSHPSSRAFALRVVGDSMTSPTGDSFPDGTIIVVDPEVAPTPGRYVVAKDVETQEATFKRLMTDGGRWYLRPLNPAYPTQELTAIPCASSALWSSSRTAARSKHFFVTPVSLSGKTRRFTPPA